MPLFGKRNRAKQISLTLEDNLRIMDLVESGWVRVLAIDPRSLVGPDEGAASDGDSGQKRENRRRQRDQPTADVVPVPAIPEETPPPVEPTSAPVPLETAPVQEAPPTAESQPTPEPTLEYIGPDQRSGPYAGFAVRFTNNTGADIQNPQLDVVVDLGEGGRDWNCQGYGDLTSGTPMTGMFN